MSDWSRTETARLFEAANEALFNLHRHLENTNPDSDEWRGVYGMRCDLGARERVQRMRYENLFASEPE